MPTLLAQGFELLVYGMGTVVVFLTALVFATRGLSWFVQRYLPEPEVVPVAGSGRPQASGSTDSPTSAQLAAISAALHLHRQRR